MAGGGGGGGLEIRVTQPGFRGSSSAVTPMSYQEGWKMGEKCSGVSPSEHTPPNPHSNRPPGPMDGRGRRFPKSVNRLLRVNSALQRHAKRADLWRKASSEGLNLQSFATPPIGELANAQGGMARIFNRLPFARIATDWGSETILGLGVTSPSPWGGQTHRGTRHRRAVRGAGRGHNNQV